MNRKIPIIAAGGILTAAICLPLAAFVNPHGLHPLELASQSGNWFEDDASGPIESRDFPWDGGDRLELDLLGDLTFHRADAWHLVIRGPKQFLERVSTSGGRLTLEHSALFHRGGSIRVAIELSGPGLQEVNVNGSGVVTLNDVAQESLDIRINGSGKARAHGNVQSLHLKMSGSGRAELEDLTTDDADVHMRGSALADVAPTGSADIFISGSGQLRLRKSPKHLTSRIGGSGRVIDLSGEAHD